MADCLGKRAGFKAVVRVVSLFALGLPVLAEIVTNVTLPLSFTVLAADCPDVSADIAGTGTVRATFSLTLDGKGGFHAQGLFNARGTATDANGNRYVFHDADHFSFNGSLGEAPLEVTATERFHLVARGGGNDVTVKGLFHMRVSPDGQVTAFIDNLSGDESCGL